MPDSNQAHSKQIGWIEAEWPAPDWIRAGTTTREGGASQPPYASLNLGDHVADSASAVAENRRRLNEYLNLPNAPCWLHQVHGVEVVDVRRTHNIPEADASIGRQQGDVCVVLTADCLPVLFCNRQGTVIAAAHAGWRGLAGGVLEKAVKQMAASPEDIMAWMGPAIGPSAFEVGDEVRRLFLRQHDAAASAFRSSPAGRWLANIYDLARIRLNGLGITQVYGGNWCTYEDRARFYSYRRDGVTGRMASLIWMVEAAE